MNFGVVYKEENKKAREIVQKAVEYLKSKGQKILDKKNLKNADFIITFGGDGTLIHTACEYAPLGIPFVGINTGRLGFLTAADASEWNDALKKLVRGDYSLSERITIEAIVGSNNHKAKEPQVYRAVNEVVVKGLYRIIDLEIEVNGENFLKVLGDGVIISTQTGSTAYSLSSGGPIVDPDLDCLLVTPINPIGLPIPSVVISPDNEMLAKVVSGEDVSLIIDGQEHTKLREGEIVKFTKGKYQIKFCYFDKRHFLKSLQAKFGLGKRGRA